MIKAGRIMKSGGFVTIVMTCLVCTSALSHADFISLSAPGVVLEYLPLATTVTIYVQLSGLEVGQELDTLAATVLYDGALLGTPSISSGPIVPNPLDDPLDFLAFGRSGLADATFLTFGTEWYDRIVSEGTFFTFDVTALALGSGSLYFDFVAATEFNPDFPLDPITLNPVVGPALNFTVVEVPEPTGIMLILTMAAGLCMRWTVRRLRR